jgi:hypothetical protein
MNRRSFIGLVLGVAAAFTFRAAKDVDSGVGTWTMLSPDFISLEDELSYVTRRPYLAPAYCQIYNTSPFLTVLSDDAEKE